MRRLSRVVMGFALGIMAMTLADSPAIAAHKSLRSQFVDRCMKMLEAHDSKVYDLCYTSDYVLTGGPETYAAPGRQLVGRAAISGKMAMGSGDNSAWDVQETVTDVAESGDTLVRHLHQVFSHPRAKNYAGFENFPADLSFPIDVIVVLTFRDGKIAREMGQYDSLGFMLDLAQGDPEKVAKALRAMKPMMDYMRQHGALPPPPAPQ